MDGRRLLFHLDSLVYSVFVILQVGLDPLMGTILEVSYLLFDVPTVPSPTRSAGSESILIGYVGTGIAFVMLDQPTHSGRSSLAGPLRVGDVRQRCGRGLAHR